MSNINRYYRSPLDSISRDEFFTPFDKLFDQFFNDNMAPFAKSFGGDFFQKGSYPKVDIVDYKDRVEVHGEIPGMTKEDISVDFDIDAKTLSVSGEKKDSSNIEDSGGRYIHRELKHSSFKRSFMVGDEIDKDKISADFDNGLLKIILPKIKKEEKKVESKKVKIL